MLISRFLVPKNLFYSKVVISNYVKHLRSTFNFHRGTLELISIEIGACRYIICNTKVLKYVFLEMVMGSKWQNGHFQW